MKFIKFCTIFSFLFLFLTLPKNISAATYYVAGDTGLDTNNGSITTPWKTIQKAADTMIAGDTVNVKGNLSYSTINTRVLKGVLVTINSGTPGNPITYQQWRGTGIPTIDVQSQTADGAIVVKNSYITIDGFKIINSLVAFDLVNSSYRIIKNNVLLNNNTGFVEFSYGQSYDLITNNTVLNNIDGIQYAGISGSDSNKQIKNNIFTNNSSYAFRMFLLPQPIFNDYNDLHGNGNNYLNISAGAHDIFTNPLFVNSLSNFKLQKTSPAINTGTDLTASGVTTDILGVPRPQGAGFDMGAYEYYDIPVTVTGSYPNFTGTSSTINTGTISSIQYSVDGGTWQTSGVTGTSTYQINIPSTLIIPDGNHTLRVKATDSYTNETDSSIYATTTFNKDTVVKTTSVNNSCSATKPEGTPVITDILSISPTQVKLDFQDSWTNTVDSYFVEYGTKPNVYQYSTQSIGGKGTKETTISNLTPNKTYYFRIRNGNNCNVGNWSTAVKSEDLEVKTPLRQGYEGQATPTPEIKINAKEIVTPKSTTTPVQVPTNQKNNTNIFTIIINWLTNAFNKVF